MSKMLRAFRTVRDYLALPDAAKAEDRNDRLGLPDYDPGTERAIDEGVAWLGRAQDRSVSHDCGVARHFSLVSGWSTSYPETTGYIVPTMLTYAKLRGERTASERARRMLNWLVSIQFSDGGFQGGLIDSKPVLPVTFNTGQILLGLAGGVRDFGDSEYLRAMCRAGDWLVNTQDADGCWRRYPTPFAIPGEKAYDTHVAWGLLEAARIEPRRGYEQAALANVRWALQFQRENGWFEKCCLTDPSKPLTHTLGYVLRGLIEAYRFTADPALLRASQKTADGLLGAIEADGFLPGRLGSDWRGAAPWACLTGSAQIGHCWLMLFRYTSNPKYLEAALAANRFVRRTMKPHGEPATRGGIKGSFPVSGGYGAYQYLNWACKFFLDSNMLEQAVQAQQSQMSIAIA